MHSLEYGRGHKKVAYNRERGPCVECGSLNTEWANLTGNYEDICDYQSMCRSCHVSKDRRARHDQRQDHVYLPMPDRGRTRCRTCHNRRVNRNRRAARSVAVVAVGPSWGDLEEI